MSLDKKVESILHNEFKSKIDGETKSIRSFEKMIENIVAQSDERYLKPLVYSISRDPLERTILSKGLIGAQHSIEEGFHTTTKGIFK